MAFRIFSAAVAVALATSFGISGSAVASEWQRDGAVLSKNSKLHRHHKTTAQRTTDGRGFQNEPYAGYRTDIAGNRYFYYRVGGDTPFGAGKVLPPPYPR